MKTRLHPWAALAVALLAALPEAAAATPLVEEIVVGPADAGGVYVLSPEGGRIAYGGMKGTRLYVSVDGTEGPLFDQLYTAHGRDFVAQPNVLVARSTPGGFNADPMAPVIFSPDGAHYAYVGRQGSEYVVIHDGREIARGPRERLALSHGALTLSPKGRVAYFMEMDKPAVGNAKWRLVMNGKPGPLSSNHHGVNPVFNADESRHAYTAASEADTQSSVLVIDGKVAPYAALNPVFTADGKSLLSISTATAGSPKQTVLIDGKSAFAALSVDRIVVPAAGRHWGAIARTRIEGHTQVSAFFLDGKEVRGTEGAQHAWFSADGAHYAVACQNAAARTMFMVVDGKAHREYQSVGVADDLVRWTSDGSRFLYTVVSGGRPFLIVNEEEIPITMLIGYDKLPMSPAGGRYGYGLRDGSNRMHSLVVDGENVLPSGMRPVDNTLTFSPDGSRYGFFAGPAMRNELSTVVIDGAVQEGVVPAYFSSWVSGALYSPSLVFSPDGKHVVQLGARAGTNGAGVLVNGKPVTPPARAVFYPNFTPDGKHLFWVEDKPGAAPGQGSLTAVLVDGVEAVRANGRFFWPMAGTFTMSASGVATFFAADGNAVKRYRITAPADTGIATLLESGDRMAADALAAEEAAKAKLAEKAAATQKAKEDQAALYAKQRAEQQARAEAAQKARAEALEARRNARLLQIENAKRARQGLPPLEELPASK